MVLLMNDLYLIVSLKWSRGAPNLLFWGPDNMGYTDNVSKAGLYTRAQIEQQPSYYNDGEEALAVRFEDVMKSDRLRTVVASEVRFPDSGIPVKRRYRPERTAACG